MLINKYIKIKYKDKINEMRKKMMCIWFTDPISSLMQPFRGNSEYGSKLDINTEEPACQKKKKKDLKDSKLNRIEYKSKSTGSSDCFDF